MIRSSFAAATLITTSLSVQAADLPAKTVYKAPAVAVASWTGFYLNAGFGSGMWNADTTTLVPAGFAGAGTCFLCVTQTQGGKGWFGTVGGGYDYQFTDRIVAGVLADFDFGSLKGTIQDQGPLIAGTIKQTSAWSAGARIGWLVSPAVLTYVNGGYSQTRFSSAEMVDTFFVPGAATPVSTPSFTHGGWFIGAGVETMFSPGWFWRTEYRYADYGTTTLTDTGGGAVATDITFHPIVQTVRSEVVFKFNWDPAQGVAWPAAPVFNAPMAAADWTGFYLNAGLGYGMWTADTTTLIPAGFAGAGTCFVCVTQTQGGRGWLGTVGGGFDYQFTNRIVVGVLADFDFGSLKGTIQDQFFFLAGTIKQTSAWSAGARIGWLVTPATLTYFTGGYSQTRFSSADMVFTNNGAAAGVSTPSFTHGGWFIGSGVETMFAPGWFLRAEYRYADYGTTILPDTGPGGLLADITFHPVVQTVRSEVVYKFNWVR